MEVVLSIGAAGIECVTIPGWTVLGVASLLTAPRLVSQWIEAGRTG